MGRTKKTERTEREVWIGFITESVKSSELDIRCLRLVYYFICGLLKAKHEANAETQN